LGRQDEALQQLEVVLRQSGVGDEVVRARALAARGQYRASNANFAGAESDLKAALKTFRAYEQVEDELEAWVGLARSLRASGAMSAALVAVDKALALAEEVRVQSANPELRATLLQPLRPAFDLKISMLAQQYFAPDVSAEARDRLARRALMTAERARARALADFQSLDLSAPGVPAELAAQRQAIYRELAARRTRLAATLDRAGTRDERVRVIRADISTLRQRLDQIDARIGAASGATQAQRRADGESAPLDFRSLHADTVLVEYWLGGDEAFAWAADGDGVVMTRLGSSAAVSDMARAFHTALRSFGSVPQTQRLALGEQLYDLAVKPLGTRALEHRRLIFVPDGALHYIPFATLRFSEATRARFLAETHDIAIAPSMGMFLDARGPRWKAAPTRQMLLVADPVYTLSDSRLALLAGNARAAERKGGVWPFSLLRTVENESQLERLPGTAQEAASIAALLPKESVDRLEGFTATRERFLNAGLGRYRYIHIASHAVTDAEIPQASALILSRFDQRSQELDGRVLAADFMNVRLNAQTVVLSACDTALGKSIAGEGLVGLRYVVLARGAESVVSSLWPVSDQATAQLMSRFYSSLLRGDARVDTALSEAMRAMISGSFKDPGLWGAFALTVGGAHGG